jgi:hypothetical protein
MRSFTIFSANTVKVSKLRRMRWVTHKACMRKIKKDTQALIKKPEGTSPLGRHR